MRHGIPASQRNWQQDGRVRLHRPRSTDKIGRGCLADRIPKEDTHLTIWKGLAATVEYKIRQITRNSHTCT